MTVTYDFSGRVAVVTGGASGIGQAITDCMKQPAQTFTSGI
ncbi:MAG: hypothetical protein AAGB04_17905 [Pseudomonadota bacterium]